jgi:hypothetical protein
MGEIAEKCPVCIGVGKEGLARIGENLTNVHEFTSVLYCTSMLKCILSSLPSLYTKSPKSTSSQAISKFSF